MRTTKEYSAGLVSQSFWFLEFKKVVRLRKEGIDYTEIRKMCVAENLFGIAKEYRATRMAQYVIARVKTMDDDLVDLFCSTDITTQKLINLITVFKIDRLFFEFTYEVYREKIIVGAGTIEDADVNAFFTRKETQSELVAAWTDVTKRHLRAVYLTFLTDANLLTVVDKKRTITPPIMDMALERYLKDHNDTAMIKALTGVN